MNCLQKSSFKCTGLPFTKVFALVALVSFFVAGSLIAQMPFSVLAGGSGNDQGHSLVQLPDSSYIVAGQTNSYGAGGIDVYVLRFSAKGELVWTLTVGGPAEDYARSMVLADSGSVVLVGTTKSFGAGQSDVYLVKVDSTGQVVWTKTYGGLSDDRGWKVIGTSDGGYAIAGVSSSEPAKGQDMYLLKVDANGEKEWERFVDGNSAGQANYTDIAYSLAELTNGNIVLFGTAAIPLSFLNVLFLAGFSSTGEALWSKTLSSGGGANENARSIVATADGGFIIGAEVPKPCENGFIECNGIGINWHYYIAKFDATGNNQWFKMHGGGTVPSLSNDATDYLREVILSPDGGYLICGHSYAFRKDYATNAQKGTEYFIMKLSTNGEKEWARVIGEATMENGMAIVNTLGGGYTIAGYVSGAAAPTNDELSLLHIDANGNSCLPMRSGGKLFAVSMNTGDLGTVQNGATTAGLGGTSGSGGILTDLCADKLLVQAEVLNTCFNVCSGSASVQVQGGTPPYSYTWMPGNVSGESNADLCAGEYQVTISDMGGRTSQVFASIRTEDSLINVVADGPLSFCEGQARLLTAEPGYTSYRWNGNPGAETILIETSGTYQLNARSGANCLLKSDSIVIEVFPKPEAAFSYSHIAGYTMQFTDLSQAAESWSWLFTASPQFTSDEQNPQFTFPFDDTYPVRLIVTNDCGADTTEQDVIVPKVNGLGNIVSGLTSLQYTQEHQLLKFNGTMQGAGTCTVRLLSLTGQLLQSKTFYAAPTFNVCIDASGLAQGYYLAQFISGDGQFVQRLLKN